MQGQVKRTLSGAISPATYVYIYIYVCVYVYIYLLSPI